MNNYSELYCATLQFSGTFNQGVIELFVDHYKFEVDHRCSIRTTLRITDLLNHSPLLILVTLLTMTPTRNCNSDCNTCSN